MTEEQILEYRRKLSDKSYMDAAINGIATSCAIFNDITKNQDCHAHKAQRLENTRPIRQNIKESGGNMKNGLVDLHNHLFEQLERLNDEDLKEEGLKQELLRARAISGIASQIIANGHLMIKAHAQNNSNESSLPRLMLKDET